jgi:hypothetical protein
MGVLQRFERRLEGLVEGTFARLFRGGVEPVEIAKALQREAADRKAISATRTLVPNHFVVELGPDDYKRLEPYAGPLGAELAAMVREHAAEEKWAFVGPVKVDLEEHTDVDTGLFRVRSAVTEGAVDEGAPPVNVSGRPRLIVTTSPGASANQVVLSRDSLVLGRGSDADLRFSDPGVSRRHAEVRREGDDVIVVDLGSTNGTRVNGRPVERHRLTPGDQISVGASTMTYHRDDA